MTGGASGGPRRANESPSARALHLCRRIKHERGPKGTLVQQNKALGTNTLHLCNALRSAEGSPRAKTLHLCSRRGPQEPNTLQRCSKTRPKGPALRTRAKLTHPMTNGTRGAHGARQPPCRYIYIYISLDTVAPSVMDQRVLCS